VSKLPGPFTPDRPPTPTQRVGIYCRPIPLPFPAANRYNDSHQIRASENTFTNHQVDARVAQCCNRLGRCVRFRRLCGRVLPFRRAGAEQAQLCVLAISSTRTDRRAWLCASLPGGGEEIGCGSRKGVEAVKNRLAAQLRRDHPCGCPRAATRAAPTTGLSHRFGTFPQPANFTMLGFINCLPGTAAAGPKKPSPPRLAKRGAPSAAWSPLSLRARARNQNLRPLRGERVASVASRVRGALRCGIAEARPERLRDQLNMATLRTMLAVMAFVMTYMGIAPDMNKTRTWGGARND